MKLDLNLSLTHILREINLGNLDWYIFCLFLFLGRRGRPEEHEASVRQFDPIGCRAIGQIDPISPIRTLARKLLQHNLRSNWLQTDNQ